jgi:hypothetical protein
MRRILLIALGIAASTFISINYANTAEVKPKFTVIFERAKEISCSQDQKNIVIDFTNYYTTIYRTNTYNDDLACKISLSYDKLKFTKTKNGELKTHVQVYENDSWIRALKSDKNICEYGCWSRFGLTTQESKKPGKDNKHRLNTDIPLSFLYISPPISDEFKAEGKSYFYGLKSGSYCLEQTPGPLKLRFEIVNGKDKYYSNEVSLSYINYDKIIWDGRKCYSTSQIITPENIGGTKSSQSAANNPRKAPTALKPCTTNEKLTLTQIDRQNYPLAQRYSEFQMEYQKLDLDYQNASIAGQLSQMNKISIKIEQIKRDIDSLRKSIENLSTKRKNVLANCDPKAQSSSSSNTQLKQCSQNQITLMRNLENQYWTLMRQADSYRSEISRLKESISAFTPMAEVARINFAIEDQLRYLDQPLTQASSVKKQFETVDSSCLNSGIRLD